MMTLAVIGMLVGSALGLRLKVFVLIPAIGFALALVIAVGIARESGIWWLALAMAMFTSALQLGYLGGSVATLVIASLCSRSTRAFPAARPLRKQTAAWSADSTCTRSNTA